MATEAELIEAIRQAGRAKDGKAVQVLGRELERVRAQPKAAKPKSFWQGVSEGVTHGASNALDYMGNLPLVGDGLKVANAVVGAVTGDKSVADAGRRVMKETSAKSKYRGSTAGKLVGEVAATGPTGFIRNPLLAGAVSGGMLAENPKAGAKLLRDVAIGGVAGKAGDMIGRGVGRVIGGKVVPKNVRLLADEGVTMTPGQRGGKLANFIEDKVLGSIPLVSDIPAAARARGANDLRVAAANRVLAPIGAKVKPGTHINNEAIGAIQDLANNAYDDAIAPLAMQLDDALSSNLDNAIAGADREVGAEGAQQLAAYAQHLKDRLAQGLSGEPLKREIQSLRKVASGAARKDPLLAERFWALHGALDDSLSSQAGSGLADDFIKARETQALLQRFNDAASRPGVTNGEFGATHLKQAASRRGFGTNTANLASGEARLFDLANAGADVLRNTTANSGTIPRALATGGLAGGSYGLATGAIDPVTSSLTLGALLGGYIPGVDRVLQKAALDRPQAMRTLGEWIAQNAPYLGAPAAVGAITAIPPSQ